MDANVSCIKAQYFSTHKSRRGNTNVRVYTSEEKLYYYSFFYRSSQKCFYCRRCELLGTLISGKLKIDENGKKSFLVKKRPHICQLYSLNHDE